MRVRPQSPVNRVGITREDSDVQGSSPLRADRATTTAAPSSNATPARMDLPGAYAASVYKATSNVRPPFSVPVVSWTRDTPVITAKTGKGAGRRHTSTHAITKIR